MRSRWCSPSSTTQAPPPAELARRLGTSRQATHELVNGLCRLGLLELGDDPERRTGRLVRLTPRGRELAVAGRQVLRELEHRFGARRSQTLRRLLAEFDFSAGVARSPRAGDQP